MALRFEKLKSELMLDQQSNNKIFTSSIAEFNVFI